MFKSSAIILGVGFVGLLLMNGCDNDNQATDNLEIYRQHIVSAQVDLSSDNSANEVDTMHQSMEGHLDEMANIRTMMSEACMGIADCTDGGGLSGEVEHGCMHAGHMLSGKEMDNLHQGENNIRDSMHDFSMLCADDPLRCNNEIDDHRHQIADFLTEMLDSCNDIMGRSVGMDDDGHIGMCRMH